MELILIKMAADLQSNIQRKILDYFISKCNVQPYRNAWYKGDCPYCGKHKFGINVDRHKANCFSCGNKYSPIKVIMELEGFETKTQAFNLLKTFEGVDFLQPEVQVREWSKVTLPESFKLLSLGESEMAKLARRYMKGRGFKINYLTMKGVGYCTKGDYMGCIIFPFYQQGELIYFIGRKFISLGEGKFKNPSVEDYGIGKSLLTYNIDSLAIYKKIYMFESIPNCLTIGDNTMGIMGKVPSIYQLSTIIRSPVEKIIIGLDDDAMSEAIKVGLKLVNYKAVKLLHFPEGRDANDIGKKATKKLEDKAPWLNYNQLLKMSHNYEKGI